MQGDVLYENLAIAILTANNYSLDKAYGLRNRLHEQGLFDPKEVATWDHETACFRLKSAGYDRGPFLGSMFASRIQELAFYERDSGLSEARSLAQAGKREAVEQILLGVPGVGPAVFRNFWILHVGK